MYAPIREATVKPEGQDQLQRALQEFGTIRGQQPGFRGILSIDAGNACRVTVLPWDDLAAHQTAQLTLGPLFARLIEPHMTGPSALAYEGPVTVDTIRTR